MTNETKPGQSTGGGSRPEHSVGRIFAIVLPVAVVGVIAYWWTSTLESKARSELASNVVGKMFVSEPMPSKSSMQFADFLQQAVIIINKRVVGQIEQAEGFRNGPPAQRVEITRHHRGAIAAGTWRRCVRPALCRRLRIFPLCFICPQPVLSC